RRPQDGPPALSRLSADGPVNKVFPVFGGIKVFWRGDYMKQSAACRFLDHSYQEHSQGMDTRVIVSDVGNAGDWRGRCNSLHQPPQPGQGYVNAISLCSAKPPYIGRCQVRKVPVESRDGVILYHLCRQGRVPTELDRTIPRKWVKPTLAEGTQNVETPFRCSDKSTSVTSRTGLWGRGKDTRSIGVKVADKIEKGRFQACKHPRAVYPGFFARSSRKPVVEISNEGQSFSSQKCTRTPVRCRYTRIKNGPTLQSI